MYVLTPTTIRTSRRRRSITSCGSYSTLSIVYTDWRNRLCSNEYGFQPSLPLSPFLHLTFPFPFLAAAHIIAEAKHTRGENINQAGRRRSKVRVVGCEFALVSIHLWQKWSNPINTDNPDMMDGVENKGEGEGC